MMWPLLVEAVALVYLALERAWFFATLPGAVMREVRAACAAVDASSGSPGTRDLPVPAKARAPILREFGDIVASDASAEEKGSRLSAALTREARRAEENMAFVSLITQSAPLLGLLGTVIGIIKAFNAVQTLKGAVNPASLAGGISEALVATAAGLAVAIPSLICYVYFASLVDKYTDFINVSFARLAGRHGIK